MYRLLLCLFIAFFPTVAVTTARAQDTDDASGEETATAEETTTEDSTVATTERTAGDRKQVDPTGTWKWERTFNENTTEFELHLQWDGKALTGEYTAFDSTSSIKDGKLDTDKLSFSVDREFNGNEFEVFFTGIVGEDAIDGTIELDFGNGAQEFDWHADRHVALEDVLGTWQLALETPSGDVMEPKITLSKDGEKLAGAYESVFGRRDAKNVSLDGAKLTWEISGETNGNTFKVAYKGTVRGEKIAGTYDIDFGGNTGTGEFTGKKMEERKDETTTVGDQP